MEYPFRNILVFLDIVSIAHVNDAKMIRARNIIPFLSLFTFSLSFLLAIRRDEEREELAKKRNISPLKVMYTEWLASRR